MDWFYIGTLKYCSNNDLKVKYFKKHTKILNASLGHVAASINNETVYRFLRKHRRGFPNLFSDEIP